MASISFVDADGRSWLVLPGLPEDYPAAKSGSSLPGLTFCADDGETRVLPGADFPPHRGVAGRGAGSTARRLEFAALLPYARPWPPLTRGRNEA